MTTSFRANVMPAIATALAAISNKWMPPAAAVGRLSVLATFSIYTTPCVSRHPPVVVMQATDDRECHDTTVRPPIEITFWAWTTMAPSEAASFS